MARSVGCPPSSRLKLVPMLVAPFLSRLRGIVQSRCVQRRSPLICLATSLMPEALWWREAPLGVHTIPTHLSVTCNSVMSAAVARSVHALGKRRDARAVGRAVALALEHHKVPVSNYTFGVEHEVVRFVVEDGSLRVDCLVDANQHKRRWRRG